MKKIIVVVALSVSTIAFFGCANTKYSSAPVNINPLSTSPFNGGTFNVMALNLALSQLQQFGTVDVVGPGTNIHIARNMPPGYVYQPTVPLTPDEVTLVTHDFLGGPVYGLRNDHSSLDIQITPAIGWTIAIHMAYPPSTLNTTTVTNTTTTSPITIPGTTTTNTTQVLTK